MSGGKIDREGLSRQPKSSQQHARPVQSQRLADCEIRLRRLTMHTTNKMPDAEPVLLSGVHVREMASPEDEEPIEWFLLTTLPVETASEAADLIGHYLQRLRIKDFFKVLKSGCRVEFLLYQEAEQLPLAVAINAVIAWRILGMTLLGRQIPECDPELMFSNAELHFLHDYASHHQLQPPAKLGDAVSLLAHFGGYHEQFHGSNPGHQIMWQSHTRLPSAVLGHELGYRASLAKGKENTLRDPSYVLCQCDILDKRYAALL